MLSRISILKNNFKIVMIKIKILESNILSQGLGSYTYELIN